MKERSHRTFVGKLGLRYQSGETKNSFVLPVGEQATEFNCPDIIH